MSHTKEELINYRKQKSKETLEDAELLIQKERWNSAANRLYYSCFYMIVAYLAKHEIKTTTHSGVKTKFNQELIKTGKIDRKYGKVFNKLFGIRQDADYEDFQKLEEEDVKPLIRDIFKLIELVENLIENENGA